MQVPHGYTTEQACAVMNLTPKQIAELEDLHEPIRTALEARCNSPLPWSWAGRPTLPEGTGYTGRHYLLDRFPALHLS